MSDMTAEQIVELFDDESDDIETVETGEWEQDHKDQLRTHIVKHLPTGQHWAVHESRRGSYWSDWEYGDSYANRVEPKEVTVTKWVAVK